MTRQSWPPRFSYFRRVSVAEQAADALRRAIANGVWTKFLPSENEIAHNFGISRQSVHAALRQLVEAGLVEITRSRAARVVLGHHLSASLPEVCFVSTISRESVASIGAENTVVLSLRAELAARGIGWTDAYDARLANKAPNRVLEKLLSTRAGRVCWLLDNVPEYVQRWFAETGLPTLVLGSVFPGVKLPSVDVDYYSTGWHIAGLLSRCRHSHIVVVLPPNPGPGDVACQDGIYRYANQSQTRTFITEITAPASAAKFEAKLERVLARDPRPTAVVTMRSGVTQTAFFYLWRSGLRVPDDISLVSRDSNPLFELGSPDITRYRSTNSRMVRTAVRVIQSLLTGGKVGSDPFLITPKFVKGSTLASQGNPAA